MNVAAVTESSRPRRGLRRVIDDGAILAGWVGVGMAIAIGASFLLVIPIEPIYWLLTPLSGLLIGYYANQRSGVSRGRWRRTIANALYAGALTGLSLALLLVAVKGLFFYADSGYRDEGLGPPLSCVAGADCVYARYLADGRERALEAVGVTDAASFSAFYWQQQLTNAWMLLGLATAGGLVGGILYGISAPRPGVRSDPSEVSSQS